jgi:hydrogenase maturation protease
MKGKVLVACVGNIFLGDDGFGFEVAQRLVHTALPDHVVVRDFGVRSYDLAYTLMEPWDLVLLVDAVPQGGPPGTVYTIEPQLPEGVDNTQALDAHTMNPVAVLQLVSALGGNVPRMFVVGCEPQTVAADEGGNMALSPPVQAAVDEAIRVIHQLVTNNVNSTAA